MKKAKAGKHAEAEVVFEPNEVGFKAEHLARMEELIEIAWADFKPKEHTASSLRAGIMKKLGPNQLQSNANFRLANHLQSLFEKRIKATSRSQHKREIQPLLPGAGVDHGVHWETKMKVGKGYRPLRNIPLDEIEAALEKTFPSSEPKREVVRAARDLALQAGCSTLAEYYRKISQERADGHHA